MLLRQMTAVTRLLSSYSTEKSEETVCTLYISDIMPRCSSHSAHVLNSSCIYPMTRKHFFKNKTEILKQNLKRKLRGLSCR